jgi:hypothetical protein
MKQSSLQQKGSKITYKMFFHWIWLFLALNLLNIFERQYNNRQFNNRRKNIYSC